jgi:hypothetical protein
MSKKSLRLPPDGWKDTSASVYQRVWTCSFIGCGKTTNSSPKTYDTWEEWSGKWYVWWCGGKPHSLAACPDHVDALRSIRKEWNANSSAIRKEEAAKMQPIWDAVKIYVENNPPPKIPSWAKTGSARLVRRVVCGGCGLIQETSGPTYKTPSMTAWEHKGYILCEKCSDRLDSWREEWKVWTKGKHDAALLGEKNE